MATLAEFKTTEKSWWCPGCGDFGVLAALQRALVNLNLEPENVCLIAGIGCSGKIGNYINSYGFHVVHGRTMPVALGAKLANKDLTVIAAGGDGDAYAIGMGHFMHALRRNVDMTYIVMDNGVYGLTKGQVSPTSKKGFKPKGSPQGNVEGTSHPLELALASGCGFVAQGFSSNQKQLASLIEKAIRHRGFALVNTFSPCVTFNKVNTYEFYKKELINLDDEPNYDPHDRVRALNTVIEHGGLVTGLVYQNLEGGSLEDSLPGFGETAIAKQDLMISEEQFNSLLAGFQ